MWMFELHFISLIYVRDLSSNLRDKLRAGRAVTGARHRKCVTSVTVSQAVCVKYDHNDLRWHIITWGIIRLFTKLKL